MPLPCFAVPKNFRLIGGHVGGQVIGGGGGGGGGGGPVGLTGNFGFAITATGGVYVAEKIFRPVPEYTRLSVRSIAVSSSVGSRLAEVVAIFVAATPGAFPPGIAGFPLELELDEPADEADLLVGAATITGAAGGGGVSDPPNI